ncbi:MAG: MCE family protein [Fibrobacter sp.]|jgi:ABC-type transporter Mla subunit MlaD|nr:MCE family protein [Fibrobacter sp.]
MSISRAQRARLGVFLIIGTVLLILFAVVPLGLKLSDKYNEYVAYFQGESLSGLEQGAVVKYSGVPIGKVERITYLPNDLSKVRVIMKLQADFPMKVDMVATTGAMGITGLKYVEITGGTNESELVKPGSEIPTKQSMISTITGKAEVIVGKVELLLNHLTQITNPDSLASAKKILDNVAIITEDVKNFVSEFRPKIDSITFASNSIINRIDGIAADVKEFTGNFKNAVKGEQIASTFTSIDSTAQALKDLTENLSLMVRQSREDFTVGLQNIREATENANQLTKVLSENPSLLLRSETQRERDIR